MNTAITEKPELPFNQYAEAFLVTAACNADYADEIFQAVPLPRMFYDVRYQRIYEALQMLHARGAGIDAVTLWAQVQALGYGGDGGLSDGTVRDVVGNLDLEILNYADHAEVVRNQWQRREAIQIAQRLQITAYDHRSEDDAIIPDAQAALDLVAEKGAAATIPTITVLADATIAEMERRRAMHENFAGVAGIPTGLWQFDREMGGLEVGNQIVVAARTSIGKTSWLKTVGLSALDSGDSAIIFTYEVEAEKMMMGLACMNTGIDYSKAVRGGLDAQDFETLRVEVRRLATLPLKIVRANGMDARDIRRHVRLFKRTLPSDARVLVGTDQLILVKPIDSRLQLREQIAATSRALFDMAKEERVASVLLHQISREAERNGNHKPTMAMLAESGSIERDADMVILLHRPEFYGETVFDLAASIPESCIGKAEILVPKNRDGPTRSPKGFIVDFEAATTRFRNSDIDCYAPQHLPERQHGW